MVAGGASPTTDLGALDLERMLHPNTNLAALHRSQPLVLVRGRGVHVWDSHGKQYLEAMAGLWCTTLGYGDEELARTAYEQMKKLSFSHLFTGKSHEPGILLADKLVRMAPFEASRVFFGNSGSDANDTQIKLVWYYNNALGRPKKKKIIARTKGYHGTTLGSAGLTGLPSFHKLFDVPLPPFLHTDAPYYYRGAAPGESEDDYATRLAANLEQLIVREGPDTVAAFIAEPLMGVGGVLLPPRVTFRRSRPCSRSTTCCSSMTKSSRASAAPARSGERKRLACSRRRCRRRRRYRRLTCRSAPSSCPSSSTSRW